ncbi:hypothetical protein [Streptomyces umbrinus]|uniref:hypothetical protein n=1 Tax=Streptomyces umbrinus TaxID=67370 RepID=UPI0033CE1A77
MNDDVVRIVPCEDQSAEEVAEVLSQAATAQGLETEVVIEGEEVLAPRSLMVGASPVAGIGFPPPPQKVASDGAPTAGGTLYRLSNPIKVGSPEELDRSRMRFSQE